MSTSPYFRYESKPYPYPHTHLLLESIIKDGYKSSTRPPLPYYGSTSRVTGWYGNPSVSAGTSGGSSYYFYAYNGEIPADRPAIYRAYAKLKEAAIGKTSQLGSFIGEWKQSLGLIGQGAQIISTVTGIFRKGVKGVLVAAAKALKKFQGKRLKQKMRQLANRLSEGWLTFWFGVKPAINDVMSAIDVLEKPLPSGQKYWGSSGNTSNVPFTWNGSAQYSKGSQMSRSFKCKQGAVFSLVNPNLALWAQLGLINPAQIVWELVPFSFLFDWVGNVSAWLGSFSDFAGVDVSEAYTTLYQKSIDTYRYEYPPVPSSKTGCTVEGHDLIRLTGLTRPLPNLQVLANLGSSVTRAASAVSLLNKPLQALWRELQSCRNLGLEYTQ